MGAGTRGGRPGIDRALWARRVARARARPGRRPRTRLGRHPVRGRGIAPAEGLGRAQQTPRRARPISPSRSTGRSGRRDAEDTRYFPKHAKSAAAYSATTSASARGLPEPPGGTDDRASPSGGGHLGVRVVVYRAAPDGGPPLRLHASLPIPTPRDPVAARGSGPMRDPTRTGRFWDAATVLGTTGGGAPLSSKSSLNQSEKTQSTRLVARTAKITMAWVWRAAAGARQVRARLGGGRRCLDRASRVSSAPRALRRPLEPLLWVAATLSAKDVGALERPRR